MNLRKHGFTLIELLVVVAIIALLTAILLPALSRAKNMTRRTVCSSNIHQIGAGIMMYAGEFNDFVPWGVRWHSWNTQTPDGPDYGLWDSYLNDWFGLGLLYKLKLLKDHRVFYCPATQTIAVKDFNIQWEWYEREGGIQIRGNYLTRGYFDFKLNYPEQGYWTHIYPQERYGILASYGFLEGYRPYAIVVCHSTVENDNRAGHLLLGGRPVLYSDGGAVWVSFDVAPYTRYSQHWRLLDVLR